MDWQSVRRNSRTVSSQSLFIFPSLLFFENGSSRSKRRVFILVLSQTYVQVSDEPTYSEAITMSADVKFRYPTTHQNSEIQAKSWNLEDIVEIKIQFPDRSDLQDQNRFYGGVRSSKLGFKQNRIYGILSSKNSM